MFNKRKMIELDHVKELMQRVMGNEKKKRNTVLYITLASIIALVGIGIAIYMILQKRREYYEDDFYDEYDDFEEYDSDDELDEYYREYDEESSDSSGYENPTVKENVDTKEMKQDEGTEKEKKTE